MISDMLTQAQRLKREKGICVLAHSYQSREITEAADYTGDSYRLSCLARQVDSPAVVVCGVRFMAQTVKILSPEKRVLLANPAAGCPMAEEMTVEQVRELKRRLPGYAVVGYVNTTAELKTVCDVCVTSSCAVKVVDALDAEGIIFIPDSNLGDYIACALPHKRIVSAGRGCPSHTCVTIADVQAARAAHPEAALLVHPECRPEVTALADFAGSTAAIMKYARECDLYEYIIGTEISIVGHLQYDCPDKRFYPLSPRLICPDMKATTLPDLLSCLRGEGGEEIMLDPDTMLRARSSIDKMIELGG